MMVARADIRRRVPRTGSRSVIDSIDIGRWLREGRGLRDHGGVSAEHALLVFFIAVAVIAGIAVFGNAVEGLFQLGEDTVPAP